MCESFLADNYLPRTLLSMCNCPGDAHMFMSLLIYNTPHELCIWCALLCFVVAGEWLVLVAIIFRVASLVMGQSNDCTSANEATLKNIIKWFSGIHIELWYQQNKSRHNKTVCISYKMHCVQWHVASLSSSHYLKQFYFIGFLLFLFEGSYLKKSLFLCKTFFFVIYVF